MEILKTMEIVNKNARIMRGLQPETFISIFRIKFSAQILYSTYETLIFRSATHGKNNYFIISFSLLIICDCNPPILYYILKLLFLVQIYQHQMNLAQITLSFSDMFKLKKINFAQVQRVLLAFSRLKNRGKFSQKLSIILTITHFYQRALNNEIASIEKFRAEVFYGFLHSQPQKKRSSDVTTTKRNRERQGRKKNVDITINQILELAVSDGLNLLTDSNPPQQIKIDSIQSMNKNSVIFPPFQPQIIAQLSQDVELISKEPPIEVELPEWEPNKLQNYQKWLALTQNCSSFKKKQKVPRTKKKNVQQKQEETDQKIDISQGNQHLKLMENLVTKIKISRQSLRKNRFDFQPILSTLNPALNNFSHLAERLQTKIACLKGKKIKSGGNYIQIAISQNVPQLAICQLEQTDANNSNNFITEPAVATLLRQKINKIIKQSLLTARSVSFRNICKSKTMAGELKGQIFHQLLHLNFSLHQKEVANFGEILISTK